MSTFASRSAIAALLLFACSLRAQRASNFFMQSHTDSAQTSAQYLSALYAADSLRFTQEFEYDFRVLLETPQLRDYESLQSIAARKNFIARYWKESDPNPLLPENDRLLDHLRRRYFVRQNFAQNNPPYFDARGKYYLKYGKPAVRHVDPGGLRRAAFVNAANYNLNRRGYAQTAQAEQYYAMIANETWSYENVTQDFVVHFKKEGAFYRELASLGELVANRQRSDRAWQLSDAVKQRAAVAPVLGRASVEIERYEMTVLHTRGLQRPGEEIMSDLQNPIDRIVEIVRAHDLAADVVRRTAPASAHDAIHAINRLQFAESVAQFRGAEGRTRVELDVFAPLRKNLVARFDTTNADTLFLEFAGVLRDENLEEFGEQQQRSALPVRLAALEGLPNAVARLAFLASSPPVEMFLQVQDRASGKIGFTHHALPLRDFSGDALQLSDLQFYFEAENDKQKQILPALEKENLALAPYPFAKIRKSLPLFCYFEIYNLRAAGLTGNYEINYRVISDHTRESVFKKISRRLGGAKETAVSVARAQTIAEETSQELFALDLSALAQGVYRLEISVTSSETPKIKASVTREIEMEE